MTWVKFQPTLPPEVLTIAQSLSAGLNTVKEGLSIVQTTAQTTQALIGSADSLRVNTVNAAIQAAVSAVQLLLNSFLDSAGMHVLLVPLPKKGLVTVIARPDTPDEAGSNYVQFPESAILQSVSTALASVIRNSPSYSSIFTSTGTSLGGNSYLVKTITESLFDTGDRNRPKFEDGSFWAYTFAVAGATDVTSMLSGATFLDQLFQRPVGTNALNTTRSIVDLVPRNIRVNPSGRGTMPVIEWDHVPPSVNLQSYDGSTVVATQYAVIRSTEFEARTATEVLDLFPTVNLTEGLTGGYGAKVLAVANYDGTLRRFIDTSELQADQSYYYHVAFKTRVDSLSAAADSGDDRPRNPAGVEYTPTLERPFHLLSSCVEWRKPSNARTLTNGTLSRAPDWYRTPSLPSIIPGVDGFVDLVTEELNSLTQVSSGVASRSQQYIEMLSNQVTQIQAKVDAIQGFISRLQAIYSNVGGGVYATIRSGKGGLGSFLGDVISSIDDVQDENRPPFDVGDEYVVAAIVLMVGPDASRIQRGYELMSALFGSPAPNAALAGIESVPTALAEVEQALIDEIRGGGTSSPTNSVAFTTGMVPRPVGEPDASCE